MLKDFAASANTYPPELSTLGYDDAPITIGLVLTGGGSHGAYEAGVLEAVLPELQRIGKIAVITGTSAGAVNAVAAGSGLNASGPDEAINRLRDTWSQVKDRSHLLGRHLRFFSDAFLPKDQKWPNSPFGPLKNSFQEFMHSSVAKFISKTINDVVGDWKAEVQNGSVQIAVNTVLEKRNSTGTFEHVVLTKSDLTPDGVGGSANLKPLGVHFINDSNNPELAGRRSYDGAYEENGPMTPHLGKGVTDMIVISLYDRRHHELDKAGTLKHAEIHSHALDLAIQDSPNPIRLHSIEIKTMDGEIGGLSINDSSKLNTDGEFIDMLYQKGIDDGRKWLAENRNFIGQRSTYDIYPPALNQLAEMHCL